MNRTTSKKTDKSDKPASVMNGAAKVAPVATSVVAPAASHERISVRAFELFTARGGEHGHHDEDWLRAEQELRSGKTSN